jgi:hypothetical protein
MDRTMAICPVTFAIMPIRSLKTTVSNVTSLTMRSRRINEKPFQGRAEMKTKALVSTLMVLSLISAVALSEAMGQSNPRFIDLGGGVNGALYTPDSGPAPHVGILNMHRVGNNISSAHNIELAKRGFMVLGANTRFANNEALVEWESIALDVKRGVDFLRRQPGITKVILLAGSGGGPLMTYYQAVAENGPSYCQGPNKLVECSKDLAGLPRADGIVFRDAHPGNGVNTLRAINPAVVDEDRPDLVQPDLDPFNPANGYNPKGPSTYSEGFKKRYFKAQAERLTRLTDKALEIRRRIKAGNYPYPDNAPLIIGRSGGSKAGGGSGTNLFVLDTSVLCCTVKPQKLLKNDGTLVTQIVKSVRLPDLTAAKLSATFEEGTKFLTVSSFLSANTVRATDSLDYDQIDWCSSNNSTPCAVRNISVPILITAMGAHYFIRDSELFYEIAKSADKDFIVIEGATHGISPCIPCEQFPGQYSNSVKNWADYVAKWINNRF